MKAVLAAPPGYWRLHHYVLSVSRQWLVRRLIFDLERRPRRAGRSAAADAGSRTRCVLLGRPPPPPPPATGCGAVSLARAAPSPGSAWAATLRQQVQYVTRRLVGGLTGPAAAPRLLLHCWKEVVRRRAFAGASSTVAAFVGITLTGADGLVTKHDRMEVLCADIKRFVQDMRWEDEDDELVGCGRREDGDQPEVHSLEDLEIGEQIAKGCNAVVYRATVKGLSEGRYNLAVKMMFNYDAESNACAILRAMYREVVPAPVGSVSEDVRQLVAGFGLRLADLPRHRNIVHIRHVFVDRVPLMGGALSSYPAALPPRLHPDGVGRNASLFVVMKLYDENLRAFLSREGVSEHTRLLLLAQLLEGVAHLNRHQVAHRDLKSDNLLVDLSSAGGQPRLVISDFGCCLAETDGSLRVPFTSWDVDRGGNLALMPPEIAACRPGRFSALDFSRADVWAAGTIAYEVLGGENPFYGRDRLSSATYAERELPPLPDGVPTPVRRLVADMLRRNPAERLSAAVAATVCQLILWAPKSWFSRQPSHKQVRQWLLTLTAKVMCEWRSAAAAAREERLEHLLVHTLLCRVTYRQLDAALRYLHA